MRNTSRWAKARVSRGDLERSQPHAAQGVGAKAVMQMPSRIKQRVVRGLVGAGAGPAGVPG